MRIDMDDPWGSPWADEIPKHLNDPNPVKTEKRDEEEKPKTPVTASSVALKEQTNSPWADDDDGFGEWAAVPSEELKERELGFDGAADGWDTREENGHKAVLKDDSSGLTLAWNDTATITQDGTPRLAPITLPKSAELARQPSPDPWATETALNDVNKVEDEKSSEPGEKAIKALHNISVPVEDAPPADQVPHTGNELLPEKEDLIPEKSTSEDGNDKRADIASTEPHKEELRPTEIPNGNAEGQEADPGSSRPSSSPSDHSRQDEILQESPRTSFDEELKRPQMPRKASSKVQELVQYFDGRAKQDEEPIVDVTREPVTSGETEKDAKPDEEDDGDDDFGDFEDGQSEIEEPVLEIKAESTASPLVENPATALPKESSQDVSLSPNRAPKMVYGPVKFSVDTSLLSKLYPDAEGKRSPDAVAEKIFIPDTIPQDSFSSTAQRKTWYRVSRYGSMRKHNSGDDENHVRVNWPQSQVRVDTLKIVARWIEEDRLSGRVVLGGGSNGSSIFGWNDSKAKPVPLSTALAAKKGKTNPGIPAPKPSPEIPREWPKSLVKDRSAPKSRSPSKAQQRSSAKSVISDEAKPAPQAAVASPSNARRQSSTKSSRVSEEVKPAPKIPVASFGWSTAPETEESFEETTADLKPGDLDWIQQLNIQSAITGSVTTAKVAPIPKKAPPSSLTSTHSTPPPSKSAEVRQANFTQPSAFDDLSGLDSAPLPAKKTAPPSLHPSLPISNLTNDDDDWGEMVSSPVASSQPALPSTKVLRHKKSQSLLGGAFSFAFQKSSSPKETQASHSGRGHKAAMSFDEILSPKIRSPTMATNTNTFANIFAPTSALFTNSTDQTTMTSVLPASTGTIDPWASADFSFFDSAPAPPKPKPVLAPVPKAAPAKTANFGSPIQVPPSGWNHKSREDLEQDKIVQSVVKGLPDLSYMLRR
jgi:hypothetical protein